jgi:hypothetical protein
LTFLHIGLIVAQDIHAVNDSSRRMCPRANHPARKHQVPLAPIETPPLQSLWAP